MLSLVTLTALAAAAAAAAPWPVTLDREPAPAPERVTLYTPDASVPFADMPALQRAFSVTGQARHEPDLGGLFHLAADRLHLVLFDDGGAHYHDLVALASDAAIEPTDEAILWGESGALLQDLGLLTDGPCQLAPAHIGFAERATLEGRKGERDIRLTHESATWVQVIDGLPTFGPGSETQVVYGPDGAIAAFSHAQRPLVAQGTAAVSTPRQAIARFLREADETGQWNYYKAAIAEVDHVVLHGATLGYWVPGRGESDGAPYEPVYAITGAVHGTDYAGQPTTVDLLWYEPAIRGPLAAEALPHLSR
jgi:hypothetical protein